MKIKQIVFIAVLAPLIFCLSPAAEADELVWGQNVGLISATVIGTDDAKGLTVRSTPSPGGKSLSYLKPGTIIQGQILFRGGWVKLKAPTGDGWVRLTLLKPHPFEGTVTKVGQPDLCLPLKKGPGDSHEKIGCAQIGETLKFSGVATSDSWLQLADRNGWAPISHVGLDAWAAAAGRGEKLTPLTKEPAAPGKTTEKLAAARQAEPGFPVLPTDEEDEGEVPEAQVCQDEWCVDFVKATITREGKPESFVTCAKDETCAMILAEFWVALLEDEKHIDIPITDALSLRLGRDGTIKNPQSGILLGDCGAASGPEAKCVVSFLLDISQSVPGIIQTGYTERTSAAPPQGKEDSSKPQPQSQASSPDWPKGTPAKASSAKQTESAKPEARSNKKRVAREAVSKKSQDRRPRSKETSVRESLPKTEMFNSADQDAREQRQIEEAWEDARGRGF
jgi:hypothetical protein